MGGGGVSNLEFSCSINIYEMVTIFLFFIMADADIPLTLKNRRHEISIGSVFRIFAHSMIWFNINFLQNKFLQLEGFCGKETPKLKKCVLYKIFFSKANISIVRNITAWLMLFRRMTETVSWDFVFIFSVI